MIKFSHPPEFQAEFVTRQYTTELLYFTITKQQARKIASIIIELSREFQLDITHNPDLK